MNPQNEIKHLKNFNNSLAVKVDECLQERDSLRAELEKVKGELGEALKWKEEDPRMLREQIRVADVAFNHLHAEHSKLTTALDTERARVEVMREALERLFVHAKEFYSDWMKGDFALCELAQCDMASMAEQFIPAAKALSPDAPTLLSRKKDSVTPQTNEQKEKAYGLDF